MGRNGDATRLSLIESAARLWATDGLIVAVNRIVDEAGCKNPSAVRFHFGGRDGLLDAVVAHLAELVEREVTAQVATTSTGEQAVVAAFAACAAGSGVERHVASLLAQLIADPATEDERWSTHLPRTQQTLLDAALDGEPGAASRRGFVAGVVVINTFAQLHRRGVSADADALDAMVADLARMLRPTTS